MTKEGLEGALLRDDVITLLRGFLGGAGLEAGSRGGCEGSGAVIFRVPLHSG